MIDMEIKKAKRKARLSYIAGFAVVVIFWIAALVLLVADAKSQKPVIVTTPTPTNNFEIRLQQIEARLTKTEEKQQELQQEFQQGIDRIEGQYKSWVKPFEDLFTGAQKEYIEQCWKANGGQ